MPQLKPVTAVLFGRLQLSAFCSRQHSLISRPHVSRSLWSSRGAFRSAKIKCSVGNFGNFPCEMETHFFFRSKLEISLVNKKRTWGRNELTSFKTTKWVILCKWSGNFCSDRFRKRTKWNTSEGRPFVTRSLWSSTSFKPLLLAKWKAPQISGH